MGQIPILNVCIKIEDYSLIDTLLKFFQVNVRTRSRSRDQISRLTVLFLDLMWFRINELSLHQSDD